jgi:hypothetical protein
MHKPMGLPKDTRWGAKNGMIQQESLARMLRPKRGCLWHPTSPGYKDGDVLICILTPLMTTTRFKAVMVMIPSELNS